MGGFWSPAPVFIAGPCVLEDEALNLEIAHRLSDLSVKLDLRVVYKASFIKANRSTPDAPRGPGLERGLAALVQVREDTGLPILTDVHESEQVERVALVADAIQIPAFLCRQTDLLEAAGRSGRPVNIKRGQWMSPEAMAGAVDKVRGAGSKDVIVTERGTFFGYGDLVVDMRSFARIRSAAGCPVFYDATHSLQQPGAAVDGTSGGLREHVPALAYAAAAAGADGFFIETHVRPDAAPSDGATMWPLDRIQELVERARLVWQTARAEAVECSSL